MGGALAIFAKTPSLSPVKTRLAADIGISLAETFYALSVESIAEIATAAQTQSKNTLTPYWALAEEKAVNYSQWKKFKRLWTDEGNLGNRLHYIYSTLYKTHDHVMMIGTDSPQLEANLLLDAIKINSEQPKSCIIGPCFDGGFYLFAARIAIPEKVWTNVEYSKTTTLQKLIKELSIYNIEVHLLPKQEDVDTINDLKPLIKSLYTNK